jgi:oligosaccharyltransferase complex subunit gamma
MFYGMNLLKMKLFFLIVATFYLCGAALSARPELDKFSKYQAQARYGHVGLNDSAYEEITSKPRDYHVAILLTAVEARYGCALCRDFQPEWELLARSWNKGSKDDDMRLLFGTLDFNNGKDTFQKVFYTLDLDSGFI